MTTIVIDDELSNKVVKIGNYSNLQEAIDTILSDYIQSHQQEQKLFDK